MIHTLLKSIAVKNIILVLDGGLMNDSRPVDDVFLSRNGDFKWEAEFMTGRIATILVT